MGFIVGLLTFLLVVDCAVLIFLVLIQLPKKEAGAGLAFGAGATDALFGAGSGNVLTKVTKYATGAFFVVAFLLAVIQKHRSTSSTTEFEKRLSQPGTMQTVPSAGASTPAPGLPAQPSGTTVPAGTNASAAPVVPPMTNLLSVPSATNPPAK